MRVTTGLNFSIELNGKEIVVTSAQVKRLILKWPFRVFLLLPNWLSFVNVGCPQEFFFSNKLPREESSSLGTLKVDDAIIGRHQIKFLFKVADRFWSSTILHEEQMRLDPSLKQNQLSEWI